MAYALVWASLEEATGLVVPPKLLVEVFTLEDRFTAVYGEEGAGFPPLLPSARQPWSHYMGATGNGIFRVQH